MSALELARWQFGVTTTYHFIFVPISIGLALVVASFQTAHHRTGNPVYHRLTRFFGKLMLLSFAVGLVTGIVQEFQFGMNWSDYSRFVGDVFGAPLAMEALIAFFLESTFIGLWIFGRNRLKPSVHLATIWAVAIGSMFSAYFILAANAWMQHPVGFKIVEETGRAEMTSIWAVLTNSTALYAFAHTILAAISTAGMILLGVSAYYMLKKRDVDVFRPAAKVGAAAAFVAVALTMTVGHFQAQLMTEQQPMKMAAAEALYETEDAAPLSLFAVAPFEARPDRSSFDIGIPGGLSFLSTNSFTGQVEGVNDIQAQYVEQFGPGEYRPIIGITYWSFRLMIGAGTLIFVIAGIGLWLWRRGTLDSSAWFHKIAIGAIALPIVANLTGWLFTEMGRQPWVVQGQLFTSNANSPSVSAGLVSTSLIGFTLLYGVLAGVAGWIAVRIIKAGAEPEADASAAPTTTSGGDPTAPPMAY